MSKILSAFLNSILLNHVGNPSRLDPRARILLPSALPCLANKNRAKRERPALASSSRNRWITPIHGFNVRHSSTDFSSDYSKTGGERRLILRGGRRGGFDDTFDRVCGVKMDNRKVETLLRRFPKDSSDSSSGKKICQRSHGAEIPNSKMEDRPRNS